MLRAQGGRVNSCKISLPGFGIGNQKVGTRLGGGMKRSMTSNENLSGELSMKQIPFSRKALAVA